MKRPALFGRRSVPNIVPAHRWVHCGDIAVWPTRRLARARNGKVVALTSAEISLLMALIEAGGEPVSRDALASALGAGKPGSRRADTHVCVLRRKLADDPRHPVIVTVPSVGYAIEVEASGRSRSAIVREEAVGS